MGGWNNELERIGISVAERRDQGRLGRIARRPIWEKKTTYHRRCRSRDTKQGTECCVEAKINVCCTCPRSKIRCGSDIKAARLRGRNTGSEFWAREATVTTIISRCHRRHGVRVREIEAAGKWFDIVYLRLQWQTAALQQIPSTF